MNLKFNKKYISIGIIAFLVIVSSILFFFIFFQREAIRNSISNTFKVLRPICNGFVIAYILTPLVNIIERKILYPLALAKREDISPRLKKVFRIISIILTFIFIGFLTWLFIKMVVPELGESLKKIASQFPVYVETLQNMGNKLIIDNPEIVEYLQNSLDIFSKDLSDLFNEKLMPQFQNMIMNLSSFVFSALRNVWHFIIGAIISIYLLVNKELFSAQAKKIVYSMFSRQRANLLIKDTRFISDTFVGFISGKIIDSFIIGILCYIGCSIMNIPYSLLISVIVGVTNIIPFFGPFIGAIPSAILILMVEPVKCLYFVIFIILLQQIDGNIIGPKILGDSTGLSGFWVIFAITAFGGLWGWVGMIVGIPILAVIYAMIKRSVERRLKDKNLPEETWEYAPIKSIKENGEYVYLFESDLKNFKYHKKDTNTSPKEFMARFKKRKIKLHSHDDDT